MVGPFPVLLPEGCFPGSVSARWYQAEAFNLAVCCSRSCPEELLLLLLPTDCTVIGTSATEVTALPVPHFPKVLWPSFTEVPDRPVGKGTYQTRKLSLSLIASLDLSPRLVTNTLLGLSRPVGKGPGGFPRKSSTTPWERHYSRGRRGQINFTLFSALFQRKRGSAAILSTASTGEKSQEITLFSQGTEPRSQGRSPTI